MTTGTGCGLAGQVETKGLVSSESFRGGDMDSTKKTARIAGLLYLVNGVTGFFSIIYVPGKLIVSGNTAATANNILASERLFRLGIVSELICAAEFIFLLWVLYRLLSGVNKTHASLMVILGLVFVPIMFVNTLNEIAALTLLRGADFLSVFGQSQREALAMLFLDLHRYGFVVGWILAFGFSPSEFLYSSRVSSPASSASC